MKKEFKGPGKGKGPIVGYNYKSWFANYDEIFRCKLKPRKKK